MADRGAGAAAGEPVVGFLNAASSDFYAERLLGFRTGLKSTGFVENENVSIEYCWGENQFGRLPAMATELVRRKVAVVVATGGNAAVDAAKAATLNENAQALSLRGLIQEKLGARDLAIADLRRAASIWMAVRGRRVG